MSAASAQTPELPVLLVILVGIAEVLAGIGALVGGIERAPQRAMFDRLIGLAAIPVLLGTIYIAHWPRWSFVATEAHPTEGMQFHGVLLYMALTFLLGACGRA